MIVRTVEAPVIKKLRDHNLPKSRFSHYCYCLVNASKVSCGLNK